MCWRKSVLAVLTAAVLAAGAVCAAPERPKSLSGRDRAELVKEIDQLSKQVQPFTQLFEKTTDLVLPSVVSVSTLQMVRAPQMMNPFEGMPFGPFDNPWGDGRRQPQQPQQPREVPRSGLGSGFVVDAKNGWIVTNAHVVKDVKDENVTVTFSDGRQAKAEKVISDPRSDLAVIQVKPDGLDLQALEWAGEPPKAGEWVIAVGSPMGFGGTVTAGIVSAASTRQRVFGGEHRGSLRTKADPYAIEDYIQTDTAINPGNSGGPLVSLTGNVFGINTLIVSNSGTSAGLGFAVPERIARPVVESLISDGRVARGHLGVKIITPSEINDDVAKELFKMESADAVFKKYNLKKDDRGVFVSETLPGGPAEKGGMQAGDLIVSIGGKPTMDADALRDIVAGTKPGTELAITVRRDGKVQDLTVTVGEQPTGTVAWGGGEGGTTTVADLGLSVQTLTPDIAEQLGYGRDLRGVIVTEVADNAPAAQAGIQQNDIILQVGRQKVGDIDQFTQAASKIPPQGIAFLIRRGDTTKFISVKPGK